MLFFFLLENCWCHFYLGLCLQKTLNIFITFYITHPFLKPHTGTQIFGYVSLIVFFEYHLLKDAENDNKKIKNYLVFHYCVIASVVAQCQKRKGPIFSISHVLFTRQHQTSKKPSKQTVCIVIYIYIILIKSGDIFSLPK